MPPVVRGDGGMGAPWHALFNTCHGAENVAFTDRRRAPSPATIPWNLAPIEMGWHRTDVGGRDLRHS